MYCVAGEMRSAAVTGGERGAGLVTRVTTGRRRVTSPPALATAARTPTRRSRPPSKASRRRSFWSTWAAQGGRARLQAGVTSTSWTLTATLRTRWGTWASPTSPWGRPACPSCPSCPSTPWARSSTLTPLFPPSWRWRVGRVSVSRDKYSSDYPRAKSLT